MEFGLSLEGLRNKLGSDPLKMHLVKRVVVLLLITILALIAWSYVAEQFFTSLYQPEPVASPIDSEILARTHAVVDQTLQLAVTAGKAGAISASFGEEVQVQTVLAENPFRPVVQPQVEKSTIKTAPPEPPAEDRLALRGLAKIGSKYMGIIADANGNSQVIYEGAVFNGWKVKMLKADKVQLTKGKRSMLLAWEGI